METAPVTRPPRRSGSSSKPSSNGRASQGHPRQQHHGGQSAHQLAVTHQRPPVPTREGKPSKRDSYPSKPSHRNMPPHYNHKPHSSGVTGYKGQTDCQIPALAAGGQYLPDPWSYPHDQSELYGDNASTTSGSYIVDHKDLDDMINDSPSYKSVVV